MMTNLSLFGPLTRYIQRTPSKIGRIMDANFPFAIEANAWELAFQLSLSLLSEVNWSPCTFL